MTTLRVVVRAAALVGVLTSAAGAQTSAPALAHPEIDLGGRLYRAVFAPGLGTLTSGDLSDVPEPFRSRLSRFLQRGAAFKSRYASTPDDLDAVARDAKRRALERAIVALLETPDASERALAFVQDAPITEWDGMPAGPLAEAAYAQRVLEMNPSTPLAPFLHLFIAQRLLAAAEAAAYRQDPSAAQAAAGAAATQLARARAASDSIYGLVADDMERVDHVYVGR